MKCITIPAVYYGLIPTPVLVIMAVVDGLTLNSSATNLTQAVNGAPSGTEILNMINKIIFYYVLKGSLGSEALVILNVTFYYIAFAFGCSVVFTSLLNYKYIEWDITLQL